VSAALEALLAAEHGGDPRLVAALDADDGARLRALARDDRAPQRLRAVEVGALSDPAGWAPQLLTLLADPTAPIDVRLAAADGLGRSGLGALVLQPALQSPERAVAVAAWRIVAALADADELGVLAALPRPADPTVAAQASFGLATIAHRHAVPGYGPHAPEALLAPDPLGRCDAVDVAPATAAEAAPLDAIERPDLHGVARDPAATWRIDCGGERLLLVLDAGLLGDAPARVVAAPRLLGVLAKRSPSGAQATLHRLVLTTPVSSRRFGVTVHRPDGAPVAHAVGAVEQRGQRSVLTAHLHSVARPGATASDLALQLDGFALEAASAPPRQRSATGRRSAPRR
jgi:hypothetical protein